MKDENQLATLDQQALAPSYTEDAAEFWTSANQGQLRIKKCWDCNELHHYPRAVCPFCGSTRLGWLSCKGTGEIYSFSITFPKGKRPFAVAYVTLPEGITMLSEIVDTDLDQLKIGDAVTVKFRRQADGSCLPYFVKGGWESVSGDGIQS